MPTDPERPIDFANPPRSVATGHRSRHVASLSNVPLLGRTKFISQIQKLAAQEPPTARFPRLIIFLQFWRWLGPYLETLIHKDAPYRTYLRGETGVFPIGSSTEGPIRIAVAADWGTGTLEAETIAANMLLNHPDYTLHLGDVYYMGETSEIDENCLGVSTPHYTGVSWPKGSGGSFALMGNHEMYSGGQPYFNTFLPRLGLYDASGNVTAPQSASFFCLKPCTGSSWALTPATTLVASSSSRPSPGSTPFLFSTSTLTSTS